MEDLVLMFMTVNVLAFSAAVIYHAAHSDKLWPFRRPARRQPMPPAPREVLTTAEFGDYVRRGLDELTVMLAQAARKPHD
jgi:hypothetical protein